MRDGIFEIKVFAETDNRELDEIDGVVIAETGVEYFIKVSIHKTPESQKISPYIKVGLYVDGVDVQYWKRLDLSVPDSAVAETSFYG